MAHPSSTAPATAPTAASPYRAAYVLGTRSAYGPALVTLDRLAIARLVGFMA